METHRPDTVFERVTAYVKDILGVPQGDRPPDVVAKPEYTDAPGDVGDAWSDQVQLAPQGGAPLDPEDAQLMRHVARH